MGNEITMCEKQMELDALREKLAKVSQERDGLVEMCIKRDDEAFDEFMRADRWRNAFFALAFVAVGLLSLVVLLLY